MKEVDRAALTFFGTFAGAFGIAVLASSGALWLGANKLTATGVALVVFALACGVAVVDPEDD